MEGKLTASTTVADPTAVSVEDGVELLGRPAWSADDAAPGLPVRVDAVATVADAVADARAAAQTRGVGIAFAYAAQPVWVAAAGDQLREAVDLLLDAALESAPAGSVAVRCTERDGAGQLDVAVVPDPGSLGIDIAAVFTDATDAGDGGIRPGRGLDLDSVRGLVEARRGGVSVGLSPDGDRLTVRLPPVPD